MISSSAEKKDAGGRRGIHKLQISRYLNTILRIYSLERQKCHLLLLLEPLQRSQA